MRKFLIFTCVSLTALQAGLLGQKSAQNDWPNYGRDAGGVRHSPLTQITPQNVTRLARAWIYHTGEVIPNFEVTPLMIDNTLYFSTPTQRVVALDATKGTEIWKFEPDPKVAKPKEHRGVSYWPGDSETGPRILLATSDARLIALDAKTGEVVRNFGNNGTVNLRDGVADKFPQADMPVTSPAAIYKNLAIVGHATTPESVAKGPSGDPRAYDVKTGKLVWQFHLVPQPGEPGNETWGPPDGWIDRAGPSTWGLFTVDTARGLVFIPTGNPAGSYYGVDRKGANRFSASVICLDAATGKLKWDFQMVHHDIFDMDAAAPPALIDVKKDGRTIPAVVQTTKMGLLFILDRVTGQPIFGVEERPVPKTDVPGEESWPTQPFPVKPPQLSRSSFKPADISRISPETEKFCAEMARKYTNLGPYTPYRIAEGTVLFPGSAGGDNWDGVAFDPRTGYIIINTSEMGTIGKMVPTPDGKGYRNEGGSVRFVDQDRYPCQAPPWGQLTAINSSTGDIAWSVVLGSYDVMEAKGLKNIGAANLGGAITTASGLIFIGATNDQKFRAFDTKTGKELWMTRLDASSNGVPITYMGRDNRQYVVLTAGGPGHLTTIGISAADKSDTVVAYALPK